MRPEPWSGTTGKGGGDGRSRQGVAGRGDTESARESPGQEQVASRNPQLTGHGTAWGAQLEQGLQPLLLPHRAFLTSPLISGEQPLWGITLWHSWGCSDREPQTGSSSPRNGGQKSEILVRSGWVLSEGWEGDSIPCPPACFWRGFLAISGIPCLVGTSPSLSSITLLCAYLCVQMSPFCKGPNYIG